MQTRLSRSTVLGIAALVGPLLAACRNGSTECADVNGKCAAPIGTKITARLTEDVGPGGGSEPLDGVLLINHGSSPLHSLALRMPTGATGQVQTYLPPGEYLFRAQAGPSGGTDCGSVLANVTGLALTVTVTCHVK